MWNLIQMVMTAYLAPSTGWKIILKITFVTKIKQVLFKFTSSIKVLIVVIKTFFQDASSHYSVTLGLLAPKLEPSHFWSQRLVISLMLACFARLLGRFGGELLDDWVDMKHF